MWLRLERRATLDEIRSEREQETVPIADYHLSREEDGESYRVVANRTHTFVRAGFAYLCESEDGAAWVELRVERGTHDAGSHIGLARVESASEDGVRAVLDEAGVCCCFRTVERG